ncbi:hypothetical protein ES332_D03G099400v1 [Gossypium tomentosum]|uniref:Membrane-associated kinase regulator 2 n=1 Tax=Gossypium tomentosum TaxID=34277 RepID=A0A5D2LKT8_GOSTO|nr:hypothetical protein ES332_D03G099400v1 [Gossypium tomentosum]
MEAFSLLKYWRGGGSDGTNACVNTRSSASSGCTTTTIVTAATTHLAVDTDDDDDGPFFDLEFSVPDEDESEDNEEDNVEDDESEVDTKPDGGCSDGESETEFDFAVPVESNSSLESKPQQCTVSLLKSAAKVRVFLLKLKKTKLNSNEKTEPPKRQVGNDSTNKKYNKNRFFTVKFKVEEVPIMSLFSKDNGKSQKQQSSDGSVSDEKRFSKDVMQRYLKKVKPLYVKVSRRYGEKLKFSGQLNPPSTVAKEPVGENEVHLKSSKRVNVPAGLRVVCKHLGSNRSASSAVAAAPPPSSVVSSKRRDDSQLQQEDGVQSAILHCKRSFNRSPDSSMSSSSNEKSE